MRNDLGRFERIDKRYEIDTVTGCWNWLLYKNSLGYGRVFKDGRVQFAHRLAFLEAYGWLPEELDHICRNRACVNPTHLRPATRSLNVRNSSRTKLNEETVALIRAAFDGGIPKNDISKKFGISWSQVFRIVTNQHWRK